MIWGRGVYRAVSRRYYAMGGYAVLHKYGPLLFHPSYSPPEKKRVCRILRGTRPIKQQASTTTYRVCVSYVCNISPINREPAMREKISESTFLGFYI